MNFDEKFFLKPKPHLGLDYHEIAKNIRENKEWVNAVNPKQETPLHVAAKNRNYKYFQTMLPYINNINVCDKQGNSILHALLDVDVKADSEYGKLIDSLETVISKDADLNLKNKSDMTPVELAVAHFNFRILHVLHEAKANFNVRTKNGENLIFLACKSMLVAKNISAGKKTLDYLISVGCNINAKDGDGYSIIHHAVNSGTGNNIKELIKRGADVNSQTSYEKLTPLHLAAQKNSTFKIKVLVEAGANVNFIASDGQTPLHSAVLSKSMKAMYILIKYGADIDLTGDFAPLHVAVYSNFKEAFKLLMNKNAYVNVKSKNGLTPLHLALNRGNYKFVKALIDRDADVNCRDKNDYTPLHFAIRKCSPVETKESLWCNEEDDFIKKLLPKSHEFSNCDYMAIIDLLIKSGAHVNTLTKHGVSPLHLAAETGNVDLVKILLDLHAEVNCKDKSLELTPLHVALMNGCDEIAEMLINTNADVHALAADGVSTLHFAARAGSKKLVKILLEKEVEVNCIDTNLGVSPLQVALLRRHESIAEILIDANADISFIQESTGFTPLHIAVYCKFEKVVESLLYVGADVDALTKDFKKSPLYFAVESGNFKIVNMLLEHKADVDSKEGDNPLHIACSSKFQRAAEALIKAGANVNALSEDHKSPLYYAVETGNIKLVDMLIEREAEVNSKDGHGPLHIACSNNFKEAVDILIRAGADVNALDIDGKSPLHRAVESDREIISRLLLKNGAKLHCPGRRCRYALMHYLSRDNCRKKSNTIEDGIIEGNEYFGESWLEEILLKLNHSQKEMKMFLHLCAFVDMHNENSCMPILSTVKNATDENFECIKIFSAINFNEYDIYAKTVFSPHADTQKCEYLNNLITLDIPLAPAYHEYIRYSPYVRAERLYRCDNGTKEIETLRKYLIKEDVSLYDLIHMNSKKRRDYWKKLDRWELKKNFSKYHDLIKAFYLDGSIRGLLIDAAYVAFTQLIGFDIPHLCMEKIFCKLSLVHLIALIQAPEANSSYNNVPQASPINKVIPLEKILIVFLN